jgi:uncharacterized membrane protein YphA (DoxX/SURF4 family)
MSVASRLGRAIFGGFFLYNGIHHLAEAETLAPYAAAKGVPQPALAVRATGVALLAGGTSIVLGIKPKWGSLIIAGFLAGVSPVMHDFWKREDPAQKQGEMINFTKNMALLGASLALLGRNGGCPSSAHENGEYEHHDWRAVAER